MNRDKQIGLKAQEIKTELESWILKKGILGPGEQVFLEIKLSIKPNPIVLMEESILLTKDEVLSMNILDFTNFIENLCPNVETGNNPNGVRLRTAIKYIGWGHETVREFLIAHSAADISYLRNIGEKSVEDLAIALSRFGLRLRGS